MRYYRQMCNLYERPWAKDAKMVSIYLYLHCCAYVQDGELHGIRIRRGSCLTSRTAIMEATGLSESDVKIRLKLLADNGEIIRNSSNLGTIITVCDYDGYCGSDDLFSFNLSNELPSQSPSQSPNELPSQSPTTPIYRNNGIIVNNNLRTHYIPSKIERDNAKSLIYEIKEIYNKTFDGILREWKRLSDKMVAKVEICIARFGRQSIDLVFEQIKHEQLNMNKNGFIPDFDFIFSINQYETYLERAKLRLKKKHNAVEEPQQKQSVGIIEEPAKDTPAKESPQEYEQRVRREAAEGKAYAIRIVKIWDEQDATKQNNIHRPHASA